MFIARVFYPHPLELGESIAIDKETAHYLQTVLRLKNEDRAILFNGQGGEFTVSLHFDKKRITATLIDFNNIIRESPLEIHLGQGLVRGDKMDFVIQKATELGVSSITPLFSKQSNVKLDEERSNKRLHHWQNIAISACEQCGRTKVPQINPPLPLTNWIEQPFLGDSLVFSPQGKQSLKSLEARFPMRIAIGPESGWDENEVKAMVKNHFQEITLGPRILRTETAGLTVLSILQGLYGDIGEISL